ncbi:hypothetical protein [Planctomicrobium piriforme]|uniref:Uncharacterized protein n=1 Tax=Planctomicrobium piriforme TaxID=1576369 RepID=A0A1I3EFA2_9PLAN|nr:hypothetical protein [Planctomicrobium piriforme]SFH97351.1 hypothetical protein SAMN05421753_104188 [Planctomicrobium piriforme]
MAYDPEEDFEESCRGVEHFEADLERLLERMADEYVISRAELVGVLHITAARICLSQIDEDDEDDDDDSENGPDEPEPAPAVSQEST